MTMDEALREEKALKHERLHPVRSDKDLHVGSFVKLKSDLAHRAYFCREMQHMGTIDDVYEVTKIKGTLNSAYTFITILSKNGRVSGSYARRFELVKKNHLPEDLFTL